MITFREMFLCQIPLRRIYWKKFGARVNIYFSCHLMFESHIILTILLFDGSLKVIISIILFHILVRVMPNNLIVKLFCVIHYKVCIIYLIFQFQLLTCWLGIIIALKCKAPSSTTILLRYVNIVSCYCYYLKWRVA